MEEAVVDATKNSIEQISLLNPVMALLLIILIVVIVVLAIVVYKLAKKVQEQNDKIDTKNEKMYNEAKADFQLVLAFEKKLDMYLNKDNLMINDVAEIKGSIKELKLLLEMYFKKQ